MRVRLRVPALALPVSMLDPSAHLDRITQDDWGGPDRGPWTGRSTRDERRISALRSGPPCSRWVESAP